MLCMTLNVMTLLHDRCRSVSSLLGREEDINQPHMSNRFNVCNMKINHRSRESRMSEPLLHVHYVLSVFQEMRGRTMPQVVDGDGMVECDPRQCVLEDDPHIAWSDALWLFVPAMTLEDIVVARILLP